MYLNLLHLSDVHYESSSAFLDDDKAQVNGSLRTSAFRNLALLLKHCLNEQTLDSVIVSGDTTTRGKVEGFQSFTRHTAPLLKELIQDPLSLCIVAGNHDVKWDLNPQLPDYFDQKFQTYFDFVKELGATSCLVPAGTLPNSPYGELTFKSELPGPLYINDQRRLIILCINSSIRCGEVNTTLRNNLLGPIGLASTTIERLSKGLPTDTDLVVDLGSVNLQLNKLLPNVQRSTLFDIPHVTQSQLNEIRSLVINKRNEMETEWQSYVKVAVFHHHVVPFNYQRAEYKAFELMADSAAVLETLGSFGFQIILTGHKHQPYVQPVTFGGIDLLIAGGMTIGGYPVAGFGQGVRHLQIERSEGETSIKIADLPCDWQGDLYTRVRELIRGAPQYVVHHARPAGRVSFPKPIESAVEEQLYGRSFYKTNVVFEVDIVEIDPGELEITTSLTYDVVNRSAKPQVWNTEYEYDQNTGTVLQARFNDIDFDPENREFRSGRGLKIPCPLHENGKGRAQVKVKELFPMQGAIRYTSFCPATDLKVIVRTKAPSCEFDPQLLYFWDTWPVTKKDYVEVHFEQGLLPYQGLQLNWRPKEKHHEV